MSPLELLRRIAAPAVITAFLVYIFFNALAWNNQRLSLNLPADSLTAIRPDFSQYVFNSTLGKHELALEDGHRAIFIGDIHGQSLALEALLDKLQYNEEKDTLVHTGDIISKGTLDGSRTVLEFMASHAIQGVRGNHDQKVIEWRAWIEWIRPMENGTGGEWLDRLQEEYEARAATLEEDDEDDLEEWADAMKSKQKKKDKKWWDRVPKGWKLLGDHYQVARSMTPEQYKYLKRLPLALHLPSEHAFVVHAGMLPYDLNRPMAAHGQPLGRAPNKDIGGTGKRRTAQERAILSDIPQNKDPWTVLNMRNVLHDHSVSKSTKRGKAWSGVWNTIMPKCAGFEPPANHDVAHDKWMPCEPMTIVYGHAASRGLDVHRWTIGLDSGCVYGRRLTALVLDATHQHRRKGKKVQRLSIRDSNDDLEAAEEGKAKDREVVAFGDDGEAKLVSVKCHKHKEKKGTGGLPDR